MKKVYIAILALAGLFATSCVQEHIDAQFFPENVTDQALGNIAGTELSEVGPDITTTYTEVDFGLSVPTSYTLWMDLSGNNFANAKKVDATISDGNISFAQKKFNKALLNLGVMPDTDVAVDFRLDAYMQNEKLSNIEEYARQSNVVTATFHVYEEIKGDLPVVDVPGDYQGWAPSDYPKLFSYSYDE
ncbi:MAG: SusE domain-containing protein, partial [Bacteroidia bacterium]|nr:SusE domain-containing protein [Bacteroidia bacterium]